MVSIQSPFEMTTNRLEWGVSVYTSIFTHATKGTAVKCSTKLRHCKQYMTLHLAHLKDRCTCSVQGTAIMFSGSIMALFDEMRAAV